MNKETEAYNRRRWRLKYDNDDRSKWVGGMPSRMREEKVGLMSPQEVKKRVLWIGLSVRLPRAGLVMNVRLYSLFALMGGACLLNRWKCKFKHILPSEFVPSFFDRVWYSCARYARSTLCLLSFIFCASFWSSEKDSFGR